MSSSYEQQQQHQDGTAMRSAIQLQMMSAAWNDINNRIVLGLPSPDVVASFMSRDDEFHERPIRLSPVQRSLRFPLPLPPSLSSSDVTTSTTSRKRMKINHQRREYLIYILDEALDLSKSIDLVPSESINAMDHSSKWKQDTSV